MCKTLLDMRFVWFVAFIFWNFEYPYLNFKNKKSVFILLVWIQFW